MIDLNKLVEQVKDIVLASAKYTKVDSFSIEEKEGESWNIVTSADVAVQEYLQKELMALLPEAGFYGEEEHEHDFSNPVSWIVDPIDGTTNFARGMQQSGISVGLRQGKELVLGVVYNADLDDMFWATKGNGAYLNGKRLSVSKKDFSHSILCTAMCLYRKSYAKICSDVLFEAYNQCADFRRFGVASLEMCYLAAGRVDTFFELRLFPWDFAAGAVILSEAGGVMNTMVWDDGTIRRSDELILDAPSPMIAANNKENLDRLCSIILDHMKGFDASEY